MVEVAFAVFGAVWEEWHSVLQQFRRCGSGGALGGGLSVTGFLGNPRIQFDPGCTPASKSSFSRRHSCTPSYKESLREFAKSCGVLRWGVVKKIPSWSKPPAADGPLPKKLEQLGLALDFLHNGPTIFRREKDFFANENVL